MLRSFQLEELERATKNFSEDCLLGSGAFGNVYKGTFGKEGTLAIKRANDAASYQLSIEEFRNGKLKKFTGLLFIKIAWLAYNSFDFYVFLKQK